MKSKTSWTYLTKPINRKYGVATIVGIMGGVLSGIVKLGWEVMFPPRTIDRMTPPQILLNDIGVNVQEMVYHYSGVILNYGNFIIHFLFSIVCAVVYCIIAEIWPKVKLWQGCAAGLVFWFGAHMLIMPIVGLTPPALSLPFDEQLSEILGHMAWMWSVEIVRRDFRNRITKRLDPEYC